MQEQDQKFAELIQAICWKLKLEPEDSPQLAKKWQEFTRLKNYPEQAQKIRDSVVNLWKQVYDYRLELNQNPAKAEIKDIESLLSEVLNWLSLESCSVNDETLKKWHSIANQQLKDTIRSAIMKALSQPSTELFPVEPGCQQSSQVIPENPINKGNESAVPASNPTTATDGELSAEELQASLTNQTRPPWNYRPVPDDEPDQHDEFYCTSSQSPEGLKLIGARVRGKMHKHQGTNCDDWFEFNITDGWTIIAVSDGAGSKKFSRIGAKVSCKAAVEHLSNYLKNHQIIERKTTQALAADLERNATSWAFAGDDIEFVQTSLHDAMQTAYNAVIKKADECRELTRYYKALDHRDVEPKDLSATLLLAVHTTVNVAGIPYSLVLTCQIGDGILAAISQEGTLKLLGKPDSGEYGGQTEFLTSANKVDKKNLVQKTFVFPGQLKALMVMTDGVADDYFPNHPRMLDLYGDLLLNQVIRVSKPDQQEITQQLKLTVLGSQAGVNEVKPMFQDKVERILPDQFPEPKQVVIRSIANYSKVLGKSVAEVVASPALLTAGILGEPMCDDDTLKPEERLKIWLDSYSIRGSFDDRTLVVLYREDIRSILPL
ncbi:PP2C family serine/threonine-protein phosphatase [Coleofasciculus sp. F4-SAH-05]|uniref:PP2C family serine/threonine-protein phosphatase n=1 Tax=Coleofasciculus sp. F4-SAH-05 TaxID=3069525 RepID=UPI0032F26F84